MREASLAHGLDHVVLAACACCSIEQVCHSCTFQRVRCKGYLGIGGGDRQGASSPGGQPPTAYDFVNIREHCAWVHADDSQAATAKATALVSAAVARARLGSPQPVELRQVPQSTLILGCGVEAKACQAVLGRLGISAQRVESPSGDVRRQHGCYTLAQDDQTWQASALVLAPHDDAEAERLVAAFGGDGRQPRTQMTWSGLNTHLPGVIACKPGGDPEAMGEAAAARVAGWLGSPQHLASTVATVDATRCRACGTCVEICEFGAPQLVGDEPARASWIDPLICMGCGTCTAHCPSGAIVAGYSTDAQLEAMLDAVLSGGGA
jgi:heterodisulfide reductase subunit A-like polyferredoxin